MSAFPPALFITGLIFASLCHELGHLLCGWTVRLPIRAFCLGVGPRLVRWRFGDTWFELRWLPVGGVVQPYPEIWRRRGRHIFLVCGGALGNATAFVAIAALDAGGFLHALPTDMPSTLGATQLLLLVANLIPFPARVDGQRTGSDGLQLLRSLSRKEAGARAAVEPYLLALRSYDPSATSEAVRSRAAPRLAYWLFAPSRWNGGQAWRDSQAGLQWLLACNRLSLGERLLALDLLATDALAFGDDHDLPQLEAWSRQALQLGPALTALRVTHGCALVELGRCAEAKALLEPIAGSLADGADVFLSRLFLALAERGLGDAGAADRWSTAARETAKRIAMAPPFIERLSRVEMKLAASRSTQSWVSDGDEPHGPGKPDGVAAKMRY